MTALQTRSPRGGAGGDRRGFIAALLVALIVVSCGQAPPRAGAGAPWSGRMADAFLARHARGDVRTGVKWNYEEGLMLHALAAVGEHRRDGKYLAFVRKVLDSYVNADGSIRSYQPQEFNLDNIAPGRALLAVYAATHEEKYRRAADTLARQLRDQPRTAEGGYWHKQIYPYQMWLDGLYMAEPFRVEYAKTFGGADVYDDVANQFIWITRHVRDSNTGLYYHGWDERRQERWADRRSGCSPSFWGRSMGWFMMALVDVLDTFPRDHPRRPELVTMFRDLAEALARYQDPKSGLWYQVVDQGGRPGNYLETSASCMFAYAFARGVAHRELSKKFTAAARAAFDGVVRRQLTVGDDGAVGLHGTCRSAGLGGKPYRDGSFAYYCGEPQLDDDLKGIGAFLLAAMEIENASAPQRAAQSIYH